MTPADLAATIYYELGIDPDRIAVWGTSRNWAMCFESDEKAPPVPSSTISELWKSIPATRKPERGYGPW